VIFIVVVQAGVAGFAVQYVPILSGGLCVERVARDAFVTGGGNPAGLLAAP